jgi:prevent-host-death family protein
MENKVGIRELKQNASAVIARVKTGETITITERGIEVAKLTPVGKSWLTKMIEAGEITPATQDLNSWLAANPPVETDGPSSEELLRDSRADRNFL